MAYDAGCGCTCAATPCDADGGECPPVECPACDCAAPEMPTTGYCYPGGWAEIALDSATSNDSTDTDEGPIAPGGVIPVSKGGETYSAQSPTDNVTPTDNSSSSGCSTSAPGYPLRLPPAPRPGPGPDHRPSPNPLSSTRPREEGPLPPDLQPRPTPVIASSTNGNHSHRQKPAVGHAGHRA